MNGFLDELNQAFLTLDVGQGPLDFQIDTGLIGTLVVGEELFDPSKATWVGEMDVDLAGAQSSVYRLYEVEFPWLAEQVRVAVLVGRGKECLLGTGLRYSARVFEWQVRVASARDQLSGSMRRPTAAKLTATINRLRKQ